MTRTVFTAGALRQGMQVRPDVHTYDLDWRFDEPLSVHVLDTDEGPVLFGAGDESCADAVADVARDHGVRSVVVEHGDGDHYGGVPRLREAVAPEVAAPAGDAPALREAGVEPDRLLEPGDRYRGALAVAVPGHTPGNLAYLWEDVLVAGDTVAGVDSTFAAAGDWSGPLAVLGPDYNADDARARESVRNLLDHDFETVLVSHGANVEAGGREAVETLVADLE